MLFKYWGHGTRTQIRRTCCHKDERCSSPGAVAGNSGELNAQSGGDDTTVKCACTDAAVFVDYFCNFANLSWHFAGNCMILERWHCPHRCQQWASQCCFASSFLGLAYVATDYCYIVILLVKTMKSVRTGTALGKTQKLPRDIILWHVLSGVWIPAQTAGAAWFPNNNWSLQQPSLPKILGSAEF